MDSLDGDDGRTVEEGDAAAFRLWFRRGDDVQHRALVERTMVVGAEENCDIVLPTLAPRHLRMWTKRGRAFVESQGDPLKTRLNGQPLPTGVPTRVGPQDTLVANDVSLTFEPTNAVGIRIRFRLEGNLAWERVVQGRDFTVGRSRECDVVLPRERVSREHLRVVYREGRLMAVDLNSTTGTSINHHRVTAPVALAPEDVVVIDGVRIELSVSCDRSVNPFDDLEPPAWLFDGEANDRLKTVDGLPIDDRPAEAVARFALDLRFAGTELGVYEVVDTVVVGRADTCSLAIDTPALSLQHARFTREGGRLTVHDLGTSRGTYVNGRRIADHTVLLEGDRVELGPVTFSVLALDPDHPVVEEEGAKTTAPDADHLGRAEPRARHPLFNDVTAEGAPATDAVATEEAKRPPSDPFAGPPTLRTEEDRQDARERKK